MNLLLVSLIEDMENEFDAETFDSLAMKSTYVATEEVIKQMRQARDVSSYAGNGWCGEFLYNKAKKTAVYLKFVLRLTKHSHVGKRNKPYKNKEDIANRVTTTSVARKAIYDFMNKPEFEGYDVAAPAGHHMHETCVFFRREDGQMSAIYFNPNFSSKTHGPENSATSVELMKMLGGKSFKSIQTYSSKCGNLTGICSRMCWETIFQHVVKGESPFRCSLQLTDFKHFVTPNAYNKYHFNSTSDGEHRFNHIDLWEELDDILVENNAWESDLREISSELSKVVADFFGDE